MAQQPMGQLEIYLRDIRANPSIQGVCEAIDRIKMWEIERGFDINEMAVATALLFEEREPVRTHKYLQELFPYVSLGTPLFYLARVFGDMERRFQSFQALKYGHAGAVTALYLDPLSDKDDMELCGNRPGIAVRDFARFAVRGPRSGESLTLPSVAAHSVPAPFVPVEPIGTTEALALSDYPTHPKYPHYTDVSKGTVRAGTPVPGATLPNADAPPRRG